MWIVSLDNVVVVIIVAGLVPFTAAPVYRYNRGSVPTFVPLKPSCFFFSEHEENKLYLGYFMARFNSCYLTYAILDANTRAVWQAY